MIHPLIEQFSQAAQSQVFKFWKELNVEEQASLLEEAGEIDLAEVATLYRTLVEGGGEDQEDYSGIEPAPYIAHPTKGGNGEHWGEARKIGEAALRRGSVAAFVVAGGQGTRLGYDKPKGFFPVTPLHGKSLFQVFAEKIKAAENTYESTIPWFIMTSNVNHEDTVEFLETNQYFGLQSNQVHCFRQGRMPAIDTNGEILMSSKCSVAMSPDGHGGSLRALVRSGATKIMEENGIDVLSYFQVDNPLIKVIDPTFIGFHLQSEAGMSSKMIPKAYADEKVGVFCKQENKTVVIEYSNLPEDLMHTTDDEGQLKFLSGSIAIHTLSRNFINQMGGGDSTSPSLPFHRANKKISTIDDAGNQVTPESPNGIKFEMFVFDALPFSEKTVVIETQRSSDFSPVKNAEGLDSSKTCKEGQMKEFSSWFQAAGSPIAVDKNGVPVQLVEVSPLFGYDEISFTKSWNALSKKPNLNQTIDLK